MRNCRLVLLLVCFVCVSCACQSGGGSGTPPSPTSTPTDTLTPTPTATPTQAATLTGTWYGAARYDSGWPTQNMVVKVTPFDGGYFFTATYPAVPLTVKTVIHGKAIKVGDTFRSEPVDKSSNNWGLCTWVETNRIIGDMYAGSAKIGQYQLTR